MAGKIIDRLRKCINCNMTKVGEKPLVAHMAFGDTIPYQGEKYNCELLEGIEGHDVKHTQVTLGKVTRVKEIASNMRLVFTKRDCYVVSLGGKNERNHFAVIWQKPEEGTVLKKCCVLEFDGKKIKIENEMPSIVCRVEEQLGLCKVTTEEAMYICMMPQG